MATAKRKPQMDDVEAAAATVSSIEQQIIQAEHLVSSFRDRRAPHALAAATGDVTAQATLDALGVEETSAKRKVTDLQEALDAARSQQVTAQAGAAVSADVAQLEDAKAIGQKYVANAETIDQLLVDLKAAVDRHHALAAELDRTRTVPPAVRLRAGDSSGAINAAFVKANAQHLFTALRHNTSQLDGQGLAEFARRIVAELKLPSLVAKMRRMF
jgi:hypothetical protein